MAQLRSLDYLWVAYFVFVIPITILVDLQDFWPQSILPDALKAIRVNFIQDSGDPLLGRTIGGPAQIAWFDSFVYLEVYYQLPIMFVAIYGLLKGSRWVYIHLLMYGTMVATTVFACLATYIVIPVRLTQTHTTAGLTLSKDNLTLLLASYVPFLVLPTVMAIDAALELQKDVRAAEAARKLLQAAKSQ